MLMDSASGAGRGRSIPSPPIGKSELGERQASTRIESGLPPAVMMKLDHQGPAVTYLEVTSRPPRRTIIPSLSLHWVTCNSSWQLVKKRRRLPKPLWSEYKGKNEKKRPPTRHGKGRSSVGSGSMMPCAVWRGKGLSDRKSITGSPKPQEPILTPITDPLGWCEYEWSRKGTHKSPAWAGDLWSTSPWTTTSQPQEWSACGA